MAVVENPDKGGIRWRVIRKSADILISHKIFKEAHFKKCPTVIPDRSRWCLK